MLNDFMRVPRAFRRWVPWQHSDRQSTLNVDMESQNSGYYYLKLSLCQEHSHLVHRHVNALLLALENVIAVFKNLYVYVLSWLCLLSSVCTFRVIKYIHSSVKYSYKTDVLFHPSKYNKNQLIKEKELA